MTTDDTEFDAVAEQPPPEESAPAQPLEELASETLDEPKEIPKEVVIIEDDPLPPISLPIEAAIDETRVFERSSTARKMIVVTDEVWIETNLTGVVHARFLCSSVVDDASAYRALYTIAATVADKNKLTSCAMAHATNLNEGYWEELWEAVCLAVFPDAASEAGYVERQDHAAVAADGESTDGVDDPKADSSAPDV